MVATVAAARVVKIARDCRSHSLPRSPLCVVFEAVVEGAFHVGLALEMVVAPVTMVALVMMVWPMPGREVILLMVASPAPAIRCLRH